MEKKSIFEIEEELKDDYINIERNKTNILPLDVILDGGMLNKSDIIQIVGESMSFKTSLALQITKSYCMQKMHVLYIDASGNISNERLSKLELDSKYKDYFHFYKKSCFDDVCNILDKYISTNEVSLIIIDTIADLINKGYFNLKTNSKGKTEGIEIDNKNSNYDSKPLSIFIKKYTKLATEIGYSMVLVNQTRQKMVKKVGTVERRYGPKVLDYSCTYILSLVECKTHALYDGLSTLNSIRPFYIKVNKSNNNCSGKKYPVLMELGTGISNRFLFIKEMLNSNLIIKHGTYYELNGANIKENGLSNLIDKIPKQVFSNIPFKLIENIEKYYKNI